MNNIQWDIDFDLEEKLKKRILARIIKYQDGLVRYGIIPLLLLLEEYESMEEYEECAIIKSVIDDINNHTIGEKFPYRATKEFKEEIRLKVKQATGSDNFLSNIPEYVERLKEFLNN